MAYLQGTTRLLLYITPTLVVLATVYTMWWLGQRQAGGGMDMATVLMVLAFINTLKFPMLLIPHAASYTFEGMVGGYMGVWVDGRIGVWVYGYRVVWVSVYDVWMHGMCVWAYGFTDVSVYGCMGMGV